LTYFDDIIYCVFSNTQKNILLYYNVDFTKTTLNGTSVSLTFVRDYWRTNGYNRDYLTINQTYGHIAKNDILSHKNYMLENVDYNNAYVESNIVNYNEKINILSSGRYDYWLIDKVHEVSAVGSGKANPTSFIYVLYKSTQRFIGVGVYDTYSGGNANAIINKLMKITKLRTGTNGNYTYYDVTPHKCYVLPPLLAQFLYGEQTYIDYGTVNNEYSIDGTTYDYYIFDVQTSKLKFYIYEKDTATNTIRNDFVPSKEINKIGDKYYSRYIVLGNSKKLYYIRLNNGTNQDISFYTAVNADGIICQMQCDYLDGIQDITNLFEYNVYYNAGYQYEIENANSIRLEKISNNINIAGAGVGAGLSIIKSFVEPVSAMGDIASSGIHLAQAVTNKNKFLGMLDDKKLQKITIINENHFLINAHNFVLSVCCDEIKNIDFYNNYGFLCKNYVREIKPELDGDFYFTRGEIISNNIPKIIKDTFNTGVKIVY
ncbi:MAG: hypothetical protein GX241_07220, partial [Ruminococcaceae bacterium]|nr:hypothetical protein [Oscillospiraceae bacterium]